MVDAKTLYPDRFREAYDWVDDYTPIIESFGTVLVRADDEGYEGDTFALVQASDGRFGVVTIGWGSCTGCDALQACKSYADVDEVISDIARGARWFATTEEAKRHIADDSARSGGFEYHSPAWGKFKESVAAFTSY